MRHQRRRHPNKEQGGITAETGKVTITITDEFEAQELALAFGRTDGFCADMYDAIREAWPDDDQGEST